MLSSPYATGCHPALCEVVTCDYAVFKGHVADASIAWPGS